MLDEEEARETESAMRMVAFVTLLASVVFFGAIFGAIFWAVFA